LHNIDPFVCGISTSAESLSFSLFSLLLYRYHKIVKKGKAKKALKEFEQLRKVNPSAALEELEKIEKARMMVRLPLVSHPLNQLSLEGTEELILSFLSRSE
jgi:hypothetical protein